MTPQLIPTPFVDGTPAPSIRRMSPVEDSGNRPADPHIAYGCCFILGGAADKKNQIDRGISKKSPC